MADRVKTILDAKYEKSNLDEVAAAQTHLTHLIAEEREKLKILLGKYETLFDGTLGKWQGKPYDIELQPGAKPYHARAYPVPHAYERPSSKSSSRACATQG